MVEILNFMGLKLQSIYLKIEKYYGKSTKPLLAKLPKSS